MYQVICTQSGLVVSEHVSAVAAHRKADKLDLAYGAIRYSVREVQSECKKIAPSKNDERLERSLMLRELCKELV
jgi:hypothetical protein